MIKFIFSDQSLKSVIPVYRLPVCTTSIKGDFNSLSSATLNNFDYEQHITENAYQQHMRHSYDSLRCTVGSRRSRFAVAFGYEWVEGNHSSFRPNHKKELA